MMLGVKIVALHRRKARQTLRGPPSSFYLLICSGVIEIYLIFCNLSSCILMIYGSFYMYNSVKVVFYETFTIN